MFNWKIFYSYGDAPLQVKGCEMYIKADYNSINFTAHITDSQLTFSNNIQQFYIPHRKLKGAFEHNILRNIMIERIFKILKRQLQL